MTVMLLVNMVIVVVRVVVLKYHVMLTRESTSVLGHVLALGFVSGVMEKEEGGGEGS